MSDARFHLFVYGTLRSGGEAAHLLEGCEFIARGEVPGTLYDIRGEHPALILYGDTPVPGEIWRCPAALLPALDAYEEVATGLTRRVGVTVNDTGCWVYVAGPRLARELTPARRIASGVWLSPAEREMVPPA